MIVIDEKDNLYKYLTKLGVDNIDSKYREFAELGRIKRSDIQAYLIEKFRPSIKEDIDETELEKVVDYYADLKKIKPVSKQKLNLLLMSYKQTHNKDVKNLIIQSQLKDVLHMCLNYHTTHKDIDIQDVVQVANMGLINALDKYDDKARIDFRDYIVYYIREEIIKEIEEKN